MIKLIFFKEIEIHKKKKQIEILELNNSRIEMKNAIESICSKIEQMEDRKISLQFEITQKKTKVKRKTTKSMKIHPKDKYKNNQGPGRKKTKGRKFI